MIKISKVPVILFVAAIALASVASCQKESGNPIPDETSLILVDFKTLDLFKMGPAGLENLTTRSRDKEDRGLWIYSDKVFEDCANWYLKTSTDRAMKVWIEKISKSDLATRRTEFPGIDINIFEVSHDRILASVNKGTELFFEVYDLDLNSLGRTPVIYRPGELEYLFEQQMQPTENGWILLTGIKPKGTPWDYNENYLLYLDENLNVVDDRNLGFYTGAISSFLEKDGLIYLSVSTNGTGDDHRGIPASQIIILDSATLAPVLTLDTPSTSGGTLFYDSISQKIILDRTHLMEDRHIPYLKIDPVSLTVEQIALPDFFRFDPYVAPYSEIRDGNAFLLSRQDLAVINLDSGELQTFNLKDLGMERRTGNPVFYSFFHRQFLLSGSWMGMMELAGTVLANISPSGLSLLVESFNSNEWISAGSIRFHIAALPFLTHQKKLKSEFWYSHQSPSAAVQPASRVFRMNMASGLFSILRPPPYKMLWFVKIFLS